MKHTGWGGRKTSDYGHLAVKAPSQVVHTSADTLDHKLTPLRKGQGAIHNAQELPLLFAFALCGGCAIYLSLGVEPSPGGVFVLLFLCFAGLWACRYQAIGRLSMAVLVLVAGLSSGVAVAKWRALSLPAPFLTTETAPTLLEGWVERVEPGRAGPRLRIRPHALSGVDPADLPPAIRVTHRLSLNVQPGRFVRCFVVLRPPPGPSVPGGGDFRRRAWFEGLGAVGYVRGRCRGGVLGAPKALSERFVVRVGAWRRTLGAFVKEAAGERAGGFAAALVSGDRSYIALSDQEALRGSGLAHLLAISGLHLGIVGGLVYLMFRRGLALIAPLALRFPVQKLAAIAALCASLVYLILSGASVSTQRAFIMSAVVFVAILADRPALSLRSFTIALCLVAILRPESVLSPGFQMSFAATGVLIAIYEAWNQRRFSQPRGLFHRPIFFVQSLVVTSVAASLATLPFALYHFDRAAPLGILANLVAMPIISLLTAPLAGLSLILTPFGGAGLGLSAFGWSLEMVLATAHQFNNWGAALDFGARAPMPSPTLLLFCGAIGAAIGLAGPRRAVVPAVLTGFGALFWVSHSPVDIYWAPSGDVFFPARGEVAAQRITFADGEGLSPLRFLDLEPTGDCQVRCRIRQGAFRVDLVAEARHASTCQAHDRPDIILSLTTAPSAQAGTQPCAPLLSWADILQKGGAAVTLGSRNGPSIRHTPICGRRPWHPCGSESSKRSDE